MIHGGSPDPSLAKSEVFDKEVNAQKESLKKTQGSSSPRKSVR